MPADFSELVIGKGFDPFVNLDILVHFSEI
jgi:hypothetical protein